MLEPSVVPAPVGPDPEDLGRYSLAGRRWLGSPPWPPPAAVLAVRIEDAAIVRALSWPLELEARHWQVPLAAASAPAGALRLRLRAADSQAGGPLSGSVAARCSC